MNERIRELIKQATTEEHDGFCYFDKAKFAELIVRECAQVVADCEQFGCSRPVKWEVLEHFGVEE